MVKRAMLKVRNVLAIEISCGPSILPNTQFVSLSHSSHACIKCVCREKLVQRKSGHAGN